MAMVVKNNLGAVRTVNTLEKNSKAQSKSLSKTSSGMKITSAQDDASGFAISERMRVRIRALDQANQNTQNDSALMKTAGGAVDNTVEILRALKEKAINAANDSNTDEDRLIIQKEAHQLIDQINDNALVQFNGKYLIDGSRNNVTATEKLSGHQYTGTKTVLLNQNLNTTVKWSTKLTDLTDRNGNSLEIIAGDKYQVSWVIDGVTNTVTGDITTNTKLTDIESVWVGNDGTRISLSRNIKGDNEAIGKNKYGQDLYTPDRKAGMIIMSLDTNGDKVYGVNTQLAGFTISIMDYQGNVKKDVNAALEFKLLQRAENYTGDNSLTFHVGSEANVAIKVGLTDMRAHALGLQGTQGNKILLVPKENANAAINVFNNALEMALDQSTSIGAIQQRLEYTQTNLTTSSENVQAAESTIRDADMAKEMTEYTKNNVLTQAAQAMLAQANQSSSAVLNLLQ